MIKGIFSLWKIKASIMKNGGGGGGGGWVVDAFLLRCFRESRSKSGSTRSVHPHHF